MKRRLGRATRWQLEKQDGESEVAQRKLNTYTEEIAKGQVESYSVSQLQNSYVLPSLSLQYKFKVVTLSPSNFLCPQNFSHVYDIPLLSKVGTISFYVLLNKIRFRSFYVINLL